MILFELLQREILKTADSSVYKGSHLGFDFLETQIKRGLWFWLVYLLELILILFIISVPKENKFLMVLILSLYYCVRFKLKITVFILFTAIKYYI